MPSYQIYAAEDQSIHYPASYGPNNQPNPMPVDMAVLNHRPQLQQAQRPSSRSAQEAQLSETMIGWCHQPTKTDVHLQVLCVRDRSTTTAEWTKDASVFMDVYF
jgi:hypothetical protein